jgi:hypothetical protein
MFAAIRRFLGALGEMSPHFKQPITATDYDAAWDSGDALSGTYPPLNRPRRAIVACPLRCAGVQNRGSLRRYEAFPVFHSGLG